MLNSNTDVPSVSQIPPKSPKIRKRKFDAIEPEVELNIRVAKTENMAEALPRAEQPLEEEILICPEIEVPNIIPYTSRIPEDETDIKIEYIEPETDEFHS